MTSPGYDVLLQVLSNILGRIQLALVQSPAHIGVITGCISFDRYTLSKRLVPNTKSRIYTLTLFNLQQVETVIVFHSISMMNAHNFTVKVEPFEEEATTKDIAKLRAGNDVLKLLDETYDSILRSKHSALISYLPLSSNYLNL